MTRMIRAALVVGLVSGGQIHASLAAQEPEVVDRKSHIKLPIEAARVMETVLARVRLRLESAECAAVFNDFADRDGRSLATVLSAAGRTPSTFLDLLYFVDATMSARCRGSQIHIAFTIPRSRVIYVCSSRFVAYFSQDTTVGEVLVIHELLHALGLGENPPHTEAITDRVATRCAQASPIER